MAPTPEPAYGPRPGRVPAAGPIGRRWLIDGRAGVVAQPVARPPEASGSADLRVLRRRIRLVRRHLGPGPYLHFGCDRGALLALLAARGSASGFVADAALAEIARGTAPGCPVHTNPDAIPVGVFRGVLTTGPAYDATLAVWRRVLVRGGRVLMIAADDGGGDGGDGGGDGGGVGADAGGGGGGVGDIAEDRLAARVSRPPRHGELAIHVRRGESVAARVARLGGRPATLRTRTRHQRGLISAKPR